MLPNPENISFAASVKQQQKSMPIRTAGHNVKTAPQRSKVFDDAQVAIGFNRIADERESSAKAVW